MTGTQRDHEVHGTRSPRAALYCVVLAPDGASLDEELTRSLASRGAELCRAGSEYEALSMLIELAREESAEQTTPVLLLIEPSQHSERCLELARAAEVYTPAARIWRHAASESPRLAAYCPPEKPSEAEQIASAREQIRSGESPYTRAVRESAPPSLRLVIDDDSPNGSSHPLGSEYLEPDQADGREDGMLTPDELAMLMDPIFEPKPRRGGEPR